MNNREWKAPLILLVVIVFFAWLIVPSGIDTSASQAQSAPEAKTKIQTTSASATSTTDGTSVLDDWRRKFRDDPLELFTFVLAISTIALWFKTNRLRRLGARQADDTKNRSLLQRNLLRLLLTQMQ
ncbi:hypothetical protein [Burkholderia cepacia]|uniref:hypothetical protein n=1 Tax=Burkholderia cepacia TaxID=292 RepID=UPI00398EF852